ncbi:hypothetical protein WMF30_20880 [Sorangium sp. So ce134]
MPLPGARRARLGLAAEAIEAPAQATVEWMEHEGQDEPLGSDIDPGSLSRSSQSTTACL